MASAEERLDGDRHRFPSEWSTLPYKSNANGTSPAFDASSADAHPADAAHVTANKIAVVLAILMICPPFSPASGDSGSSLRLDR
jgi:hypothetical protein